MGPIGAMICLFQGIRLLLVPAERMFAAMDLIPDVADAPTAVLLSLPKAPSRSKESTSPAAAGRFCKGSTSRLDQARRLR